MSPATVTLTLHSSSFYDHLVKLISWDNNDVATATGWWASCFTWPPKNSGPRESTREKGGLWLLGNPCPNPVLNTLSISPFQIPSQTPWWILTCHFAIENVSYIQKQNKKTQYHWSKTLAADCKLTFCSLQMLLLILRIFITQLQEMSKSHFLHYIKSQKSYQIRFTRCHDLEIKDSCEPVLCKAMACDTIISCKQLLEFQLLPAGIPVSRCTQGNSSRWPKSWAPATHWETQVELQVPGFSVAEPWPWWPFRMEPSEGRSLSLPLALSLCLSNRQK